VTSSSSPPRPAAAGRRCCACRTAPQRLSRRSVAPDSPTYPRRLPVGPVEQRLDRLATCPLSGPVAAAAACRLSDGQRHSPPSPSNGAPFLLADEFAVLGHTANQRRVQRPKLCARARLPVAPPTTTCSTASFGLRPLPRRRHVGADRRM
jgi:hypothetical protein